ncbi:Zn-dependent exopeptidase [Russula aff. rugulosa BPL654]|nr:Zn-dependent exopeptidase [Russula aff. rugulosa BPL654]
MEPKRPLVVDPELLNTPRPTKSPAKKLLKYVVSLGLLWYILHRWLFLLAFNASAHDLYSWAIDAFGPKVNGLTNSQLTENFFLTIPNSASATVASRRYATSPHLAGSEGDLRTAKDFFNTLQREFSIPKSIEYPFFPAGSEASRNATLSITNLTQPTAWIDIYYPVLNTPLDRSLEILGDDGSAVWKADLEEIADELDSDAHAYAKSTGAWHGLSHDGEAVGRLIYANYGRKRDYDDLVQKGVDFTGAVVIVRYGGIFRGLKIKGAQELGAAGVLIYSDPRDDGTVTEQNGYAAYPHGPARNPTSVQRGSVQFISMYPGDPTTPGYPSYENSTRTNASSIPSIPSLPISWANAKVLLEGIEGKNRTVRLINHVDNKVTPIWNVIGVIPGYIKDEVVLVGNHRDAWVLGAADPSSGTVATHELIRGLGSLLKEDWKPLRTIVIASWDAEEYGLIGSTEWGEDFAEWIQKYVVAYVNIDTAVAGSTFGAEASPLLSHFIRKTAEDLPHPTDPKRTLWDATADRGQLFGEHDDINSLGTEVETQAAADSVGIRPLGSGSDYTVFLQRLGVASADSGGFHSTRSDPVYHYHSVFDSERFQEVYADPGFVKHVAIAKNMGLQTLRLAGALVLPFNTTHYAFELANYLDRVEGLAAASSANVNFAPLRAAIRSLQFASLKLDTEKHAAERVLRNHLRKWRKHQRKHKRKDGFLKRLIRRLKYLFTEESNDVAESAPQFADGKHQLGLGGMPDFGLGNDHEVDIVARNWPRFPLPRKPKHPHCPPPKLIKALKVVRKINQKLVSFERGFIHEDGIKDREWYRHLGVAPGKWLGYGATTLPALTEAITIENNVTLANYEVMRLTERVDTIAAALRA